MSVKVKKMAPRGAISKMDMSVKVKKMAPRGAISKDARFMGGKHTSPLSFS